MGVVAAALVAFSLVGITAPVKASAETRTLKLHNTHTGEQADITFKRNGRFVQSGLRELNRFLRDHRRNEPTRMDPELFDLVWEVYRASGARNRIHVVSAYRSPATNEMLRRTRGGQARKSQHTLGRAMDFFIPGVSTQKLRELGFKLQGGGVGYYPKSATPFVHLDTGNVRAWPRMSRQQLTRLFPDGRTLHIPPDGKRLPGYQQALAAYNSRKRAGEAPTLGRQRGSGGGLLAGVFGNNRDRDEAPASANRRQSQPQRQAPAPETPRTLLAALPAANLPTPSLSPRAAPAAETLAPAQQTVPQQTAPVAIEETPGAPFIAPPLPQRRPAVLLASAEPPALRQSASDLEASVSGRIAGDGQQPMRPEDAAAILAALGVTRDGGQQDTTQLAYAVPIPTRAPRLDGSDQPLEVETLIARATPDQDARTPLVTPGNAPIAAPEPAAEDGSDRLAVPAARPLYEQPALFRQPGIGTALDSGVETTPKSDRPTVKDALAAQPKLISADDINPARFGDWPTTHTSLATHDSQVTAPQFVMNASQTRAQTVVNAGFSKAPGPDSNRFSGEARALVPSTNLLSVAPSGGDGQILSLDIPASN